MSLASFAFGMQLLLGAAAAYGFSRGRSARTVAVTLAAGVVVLQLTQAGYAMQKYVEGPGGRFSPPVTERDWIDDAIYGKAKAAMFVSGQSNSTAFDPVWLEVQFWNTSLASVYAPGQQFIQVPIGDPTHTYAEDEDTGGLTVSHPFPPYAVVARSFNDRALAGAVVKQAPYMAIDLMRPDRPLQLRYHVLDAAPDGLLGAGDEARLRVFAGGLDPARRWCAGVPFFTPVGANGRREPLPYEITGKGFRTRGEVAAEQTKIIQVPLSFGSAPHLDFKIAPPGRVKLDDGRFVSGQLGQIFVEPCKG
jgi:hypothetical protein